MRKPVGYLEQHNDQILLASGNGTFFSIKKNKIAELILNDNEDLTSDIAYDKHGSPILESNFDRLTLNKIETNFRDIAKDQKLI